MARTSLPSDDEMIEHVVRHLRAQGVAFRFVSYPAPEPGPAVAHLLRPSSAVMLKTRLLSVDGRLALAAAPDTAPMNLPRLRGEIGARLLEPVGTDRLAPPFTGVNEPLPPLGTLLGAALFVDASATGAGVVGFPVFSATEFFELSFEDLARIEHPRVASFLGGGELPAHPAGP